jgi:hypothetical protein
MFWVLMVGTLALFDSDEPWLREKWRLDILPLKDIPLDRYLQ